MHTPSKRSLNQTTRLLKPMPNYEEIYNATFLSNPGYQSWIGSPGVRLAFANQERLMRTGDRHLDYGCGAGFVVESMRSHVFNEGSFGTDVSSVMCNAVNKRLGGQVALQIKGGKAPFEDHAFDLVTCFDVLEHVDEEDIPGLRDDILRLLSPGGLLFCNISLRLAVSVDLNGDNLHRTVRPADWWDSIFSFDSFAVTKDSMEMTAWKMF